ncbi:uncharacterized protein TM35_000192710 [Trypanosoma theileri]|uniref:Uncharacterized protein n=1 Tax=Trypanosoma theileri TaxID=67003 RepID=A0A1X0NTI1_9TRYP|nr:uncharacterized protein TM35_000192710 [Trypanosoma theileri]ORC88027.1 hypothetical protein TM35_000192710 [Trypanosoma theileri]
MRWLVRSVIPPVGIMRNTSITSGTRLLCTTRTIYAPKRSLSTTRKSNSPKTSALSRRGSSSSGSNNSRGGAATALKENSTTTATTTPTSRANTIADTVPGFAASTISLEEGEEEAERRLMEGDTRLAMRLLMQRHFLYQNNARRPEERRLEEERDKLRRKHRARMERIEEKTRNSIKLGSDIAVDGILPLYRHSKAKGAAAAAAGAGMMAASTGSWMRLNPVEAESIGMTDDDDYNSGGDGGIKDIHASALLMKPDISAYDSEHDQRICSSEVLDEEQKRSQGEPKDGEGTVKLLSKEELEMSAGLTPQRVMQSQLLQDEDQDFAVEAYLSDIDE